MDKKRYLIREYVSLCEGGVCEDLLNESEKKMRQDGAMILSGKLSEADRKNQNGRIYSRSILDREMSLFDQLIKEGSACGELDHPTDDVINLANASHLFLRTWWQDDTVFGVCKVLSTPQGKVLEALIKDGVSIGISSRGVGSVVETARGTEVSEDFQLSTFDIVATPSSQGAFLQLTESKLSSREVDNIRFPKNVKINMLIEDILRNK